MRRILKFVINPWGTDITTEDEPRFLAVGAQEAAVVVWAEATPGVGVLTKLEVSLTGQAPPEDGEYLGTATQSEGIVVHVYRRRNHAGPDTSLGHDGHASGDLAHGGGLGSIG